MLITEDEQENLLVKYMKTHSNTYTWQGFIDGMNAAFKLIDEKLKLEQTQINKNYEKN